MRQTQCNAQLRRVTPNPSIERTRSGGAGRLMYRDNGVMTRRINSQLNKKCRNSPQELSMAVTGDPCRCPPEGTTCFREVRRRGSVAPVNTCDSGLFALVMTDWSLAHAFTAVLSRRLCENLTGRYQLGGVMEFSRKQPFNSQANYLAKIDGGRSSTVSCAREHSFSTASLSNRVTVC